MANIVINMTGDNADAIRQFQGVLAEEKKQEAALRKMAQENAKSAAEHKKLQDAAKRVWEQTRTPLEKYNAEVAKLDRLMKTTDMSTETYRRRVAQLKSEYEQAENAGKKAFGAGALSQLASLAAGYLSISTAINLVTTALNDQEAARKDAAERAKASRMDLGSLAQVSDTPEEFSTLVQQARDVYKGGGAESLGQAAQIVFATKSADEMKHLGLFQEMRASGLVQDTGMMATAAATIKASMGEKETGDLRAIISKGIAASLPGAGSAEALMEAAARSGGSAAALRMRDEEVLAAVAIASKSTGSPERAGTNVASLFRSLDEKEEFKGMSFKGALEKLKGKGLEGAALQEYLGREEALAGYRAVMQNVDLYDKALGDIEKAEKTDYVGQKVKYHAREPGLAAARQAAQSQATEQLSREPLGTRENIANAMRQREEAALRASGVSEWKLWGQRKLDDFAQWSGGPEEIFRTIQFREQQRKQFGNESVPAMDDLFAVLRTLNERQTEAAAAMSEAAGEVKDAGSQLKSAAQQQAANQRANPAVHHRDKQ
jgi:uncharacterized protein (DUF2384 family)